MLVAHPSRDGAPVTRDVAEAIGQLRELAPELLGRTAAVQDGQELAGFMVWASKEQDESKPEYDLASATSSAAEVLLEKDFPREARVLAGIKRTIHGMYFSPDEDGQFTPKSIITVGRAFDKSEDDILSMKNLVAPGLLDGDGRLVSRQTVRDFSRDVLQINPDLIYGVEALSKMPGGHYSPDIEMTHLHLFSLYSELARLTGVNLDQFSLYVELNKHSRDSIDRAGVKHRDGAYGYNGVCYFPVFDESTNRPNGEYEVTGQNGGDTYTPHVILGARENSANFEIADAFCAGDTVYLLNGEVDKVKEIGKTDK